MVLLRATFAASLFFATSTMGFAQTINLNDAPEIKVYTFNVGWYGRVYAGFSSPNFDLTHLKAPGARNVKRAVMSNYMSQAVDGVYRWKDRGNVDDTWLLGFALGYRFNDLLRFDLSYDYRGKSSFKGSDFSFAHERNYKGDITSNVFMLNGFIDLGTFKGITPYIGAGVGAVANHVKNLSVTKDANAYTVDGKTEWGVAWALHAGVGIQLSERTTLEVGYSYTDIGDAKSGENVDNIGHFKVKDITSHDVKVGLRYLFH